MIAENMTGIRHEEKGLTAESPVAVHQKCYREDTFVRMHYHSSFELNICENLRGTINVEGGAFDLSRTHLVFLPPGTLHSYRIEGSTGSIKVWHLGLHLLPLINCEAVNCLFQENSYHISRSEDDALRTEELLSEIRCSEVLIRSAAVLKLLSIFQVQQQMNKVSGKNLFLHRIINWTEANYRENISLDDASSAVHLSRYHFSRKFKENTGSTYIEYLNNLRLESSLRLLRKGMSVSETAGRTGFSDVSYFIKKFRIMYLQTPLEYQKSL